MRKCRIKKLRMFRQWVGQCDCCGYEELALNWQWLIIRMTAHANTHRGEYR